MIPSSSLLLLALSWGTAHGFDYGVSSAGEIEVKDVETGKANVQTLFTDKEHSVSVAGIEWESSTGPNNTSTLKWELFVDGNLAEEGNYSLADAGRMLPTELDTGSFTISDSGRHVVEVVLTVDTSEAETSRPYEAYAPGVSLIPLIMILLFAVFSHMVEFSLFLGIFIGACMVSGNVNDGFKLLLEKYILQALADEDHGYVYLFTLFLSGLVGMMEKSGGMYGFTKDISVFATTARLGQFACFAVGCFVFFDDYANTLLAGGTMRPLLDSLFVSREKLSFIVDATAAPIASISPVSSWVGFEVGLINDEIAAIKEQFGDDLYINDSGFAVFLQSIKYRYYPIYMLILMVVLIYAQRDFGTMLVAERKCRVYQRTDGGDGKGKASEVEGSSGNNPRKDQPLKSWNMIVPVLLLIFLIFWLLVETGDDGSGNQSLMNKIENSNSYQALLWGTMGTDVGQEEEEEPSESNARYLMNITENVESFLFGMARIFPALIVLTLAWASGAVMKDVGADRLFSSWIVGGVSADALPTLSFIISMFMALATGTSWGTMTILFPLLMVPTYEVADGDATIFYATVAGILSGAVAGDHMSPISDTTVLSALACDCELLNHVGTQAPYAAITAVISIILGTIPIGYGENFPNIVGILLGVLVIVLFVYFVCVPIVSPSGRYDIFTEIALMIKNKRGILTPMAILKDDTIKFYQGDLDKNNEKETGHEGADGNDDDEDLVKEGVPHDEGISHDLSESEVIHA